VAITGRLRRTDWQLLWLNSTADRFLWPPDGGGGSLIVVHPDGRDAVAAFAETRARRFVLL
jgi:hypothetical protein